jgi:glycosyltransferase involved in cell wall biosynthesis
MRSFHLKATNIAIISHSASLTGAPLITSALVRHLAQDNSLNIDYIFLSAHSFGRHKSLASHRFAANVHVISGAAKGVLIAFHALRSYFKQGYIYNPGEKRNFVSSNRYKLVYASSIASLEAGYILKKSTGAKLVLHLHEMLYWIKTTCQANPSFAKYLDVVDVIIAPTPKCIASLKAVSNINAKTTVAIIPEPSNIRANASLEVPCLDLAQSDAWMPINSALSSGKTICICNGTDSWRKGLEYFLLTASCLNKKHNGKFHFLWISLSMSIQEKVRVEIECSHLGITDCISFMDPVEDLRKLLRVSSCYMLTSREDPMPVAALEAFAEDVPVICFEGTGAIPDMLESSKYQVVPYGNTSRFAESVCRLAFDHEARQQAILFQRKRVADCSSDCVFEAIRSTLLNFLYAN